MIYINKIIFELILYIWNYNFFRVRSKPEITILEIWSANNKPKAIAPAINVTSSIVLIALLK